MAAITNILSADATPTTGTAPLLAPAPKPKSRLLSLDIVRGFTVLLMVFVDEIGGAYPHLNHSPWNNITLADLVMPWFLFMVGTSLSISLRRYKANGRRVEGTQSALLRAVKLFGLGMLLQGGDWIDSGYIYGYNLATLRFCGILNRIAYAYLVAALTELWVPEAASPTEQCSAAKAHLLLFSGQAWRWLVVSAFVALHLALTLGTYVPSWDSWYGWNHTVCANNSACAEPSVRLATPFTVHCDVRGALATPECSAAGYWDRALFGQAHLGAWMSRRLPECSSCSPGAPDPLYAPSCRWLTYEGAPAWCFAHMYDPEGALATVPTVMNVWLGAHFGRALHFAPLRGRQLLVHWSVCAAALLATGLAVHYGGLPMNKQAWSTSYLATLRRLLYPLQCTGMNAIFFFFWHGTAEAILNAIYYREPAVGGSPPHELHNLGADSARRGLISEALLGWIPAPAARQMVFVWLKVGAFMAVAVGCHRRGYYWRV